MLVLGINGSPRRKSNSGFLLDTFLAEAEKLGASVRLIDVPRSNIKPCMEYTVCEKHGTCPIEDDLASEGYALLRRADVVVAATPVFFYNMSAQLKALVDRCQTLWARKYMLRLKDPASAYRRGYLLSVGATRGKNLFDAIELSIRYFFDALSASYEGALTYRGIEKRGDMQRHPGVREDVRRAVAQVVGPLAKRKRVLFVGRGDACRSQMAAAFARRMAGEKCDVQTAGRQPARALSEPMVKVMQEKGIDMGFRQPCSLEQAFGGRDADLLVSVEAGRTGVDFPAAETVRWPLKTADQSSEEAMRRLRDDVESRVRALFG
jgi:multimeric flavodoxin WrbA/protein-tyrosine-phosphatase